MGIRKCTIKEARFVESCVGQCLDFTLREQLSEDIRTYHQGFAFNALALLWVPETHEPSPNRKIVSTLMFLNVPPHKCESNEMDRQKGGGEDPTTPFNLNMTRKEKQIYQIIGNPEPIYQLRSEFLRFSPTSITKQRELGIENILRSPPQHKKPRAGTSIPQNSPSIIPLLPSV